MIIIIEFILTSDLTQKSHEPPSNKKYSSTAYSKQISLDASKRNDDETLQSTVKRYNALRYKKEYNGLHYTSHIKAYILTRILFLY